MPVEPFAAFEMIRVINLPERKDRRAEMEQELAKIGMKNDPRIMFFPAFRPDSAGAFTSIGARGVYQSQHAILREAANAKKSVLILEDDCEFLASAGSYDCEHGWDIFYGGYFASDSANLEASDIIGAHMMGFTAHAAQLVCHYLDTLTYDGIHPPIDAAYIWFRRSHPEVRTKFAIPALAGQRSSRSDIASLRFFDRIAGLRGCASFARRVRRKLRRRI